MDVKESIKDVNGKESSKRVWAGRYLFTALFMAVGHFIAGVLSSIFGFEYSASFPHEIWYGMVGGGFGILGFTIFEKKNQ